MLRCNSYAECFYVSPSPGDIFNLICTSSYLTCFEYRETSRQSLLVVRSDPLISSCDIDLTINPPQTMFVLSLGLQELCDLDSLAWYCRVGLEACFFTGMWRLRYRAHSLSDSKQGSGVETGYGKPLCISPPLLLWWLGKEGASRLLTTVKLESIQV